jgi:uncharacterized protein (TIGR02569 family)
LHAFGLAGAQLVPLSGGQGQAWLADEIVLKPTADEREAMWIADVLDQLDARDVRISRPIEARDGSWVVDGWTAWRWIDGRHDFAPQRWTEVIDVGRTLHAALRDVDAPTFLRHRTHPWAVGDRMAWGEQPIEVASLELRELVDRLASGLRPLDLAAQVIHGDLAGNVLFGDGLTPGVIDFSPYHRPIEFASAVVVNDAIAWYEAPTTLAHGIGDVPDLAQLLRRAAIYRLVSVDRLAKDRPTVAHLHAVAHTPVAALAEQLEG